MCFLLLILRTTGRPSVSRYMSSTNTCFNFQVHVTTLYLNKYLLSIQKFKLVGMPPDSWVGFINTCIYVYQALSHVNLPAPPPPLIPLASWTLGGGGGGGERGVQHQGQPAGKGGSVHAHSCCIACNPLSEVHKGLHAIPYGSQIILIRNRKTTMKFLMKTKIKSSFLPVGKDVMPQLILNHHLKVFINDNKLLM